MFNNYIKCGYRRAWIMWDLDNGHSWRKNDAGKGYVWVFPTRKQALEHRAAQHKGEINAKLSYPVKIEFGN